MSIAAARKQLVAHLAAQGVPAQLYDTPPSMVNPPAVIVVPDDPYLQPQTIGATLRLVARFRVTCAVVHLDNVAALDQLERLVVAVWQALPSGVEVGTAARPTLEQVGSNDLLTTVLNISQTLTLS